jgi:hypothetical protein
LLLEQRDVGEDLRVGRQLLGGRTVDAVDDGVRFDHRRRVGAVGIAAEVVVGVLEQRAAPVVLRGGAQRVGEQRPPAGLVVEQRDHAGLQRAAVERAEARLPGERVVGGNRIGRGAGDELVQHVARVART